MKAQIAVLAGDGIGPEIVAEAIKVLEVVAQAAGHEFNYRRANVGGVAWEQEGVHLPESTLTVCGESDAILFGAVGGPVDEAIHPKWHNCERNALLALRRHFQLGVNIRPIRSYGQSPAREVDILCIRELTGGIYFGAHEASAPDGVRVARDVMEYSEDQIRPVAHAAFRAAGARKRCVASVDKANVLECSRLWRSVVDEVARDYPHCEVTHILVDNAALQLVRSPESFDVLLAPNLFGDILTDEASYWSQSLGMLPSASINASGFGLYEPAGGSAPGLAGRGVANPIGQILSAALLLRHSFQLVREAQAIEEAVAYIVDRGYGTADMEVGKSATTQTTSEMGDLIVAEVLRRLRA